VQALAQVLAQVPVQVLVLVLAPVLVALFHNNPWIYIYRLTY